MAPDELYVWELVRAATVLPKGAIPLAAHLLVVPPLASLPADTRGHLHGLLHALGSVERTPAVEAFLAALADSSSSVQDSPHWHILRMLRQERHAAAALEFMHAVAAAGVRQLGGEPLRP